MNKRIIELRKFFHLTQAEFAEKIGLTRPALSAMETNRCDITESNKILISQTFHVNRLWLETGEGDMFVKFNPVFDEFSHIFDCLDIKLQEFLLDTAKRLIDLQDDLF